MRDIRNETKKNKLSMKKCIFIVIIMASMITSCGIYQGQTTFTNIANYSAFEGNGIYATESNTIPYEYRPIGKMTSVTHSTLYSKLDMESAFQEIANNVAINGGNGIINLNIDIDHIKGECYMTVTGMAVNIIDDSITDYLNEKKNNAYLKGMKDSKEKHKTKSKNKKNKDDIYEVNKRI